MSVTYEWVIEEVDADGDIINVDHTDTLADALKRMQYPVDDSNHNQLGLVRDTWSKDDPGNLEDRQWAYVEDGKLPAEFDGGAKVPKRFHAEINKSN